MARLDNISPRYIGEDRIALELADPQLVPFAFVPFQVNVSYASTAPGGIVLPLELIFQAPTGRRSQRFFTRSQPSSLLLTPTMRGRHLVLLRECFHNRWQGRLLIDVEGEDYETQDADRTL